MIAQVWEEGLLAYKLEPLKQGSEQIFRSDTTKLKWPWEELRGNLAGLARVDQTTINNLLASGQFDTLTLPAGGFFVLSRYPAFLDQYLDKFYLALLKASYQGN